MRLMDHQERLDRRLEDLASAETLLVVSDFDGTLAEFSTDRMAVPVNADSLRALEKLGSLPGTEVAILSGRALEELVQLCPLGPPVRRIGSHGAQPEGERIELSAAQSEALEGITAQLEEICEGTECFVEYKPFQRGLHYRPVAGTPLAEEVHARALGIDAQGARVIDGKFIVEFSVAAATKGTWLAAEVDRRSPAQAVFLGDDATDELGFAALAERGYPAGGIKVGPGATQAALRLGDVGKVGEFLSHLAAARRLYFQERTR